MTALERQLLNGVLRMKKGWKKVKGFGMLIDKIYQGHNARFCPNIAGTRLSQWII